MESLILLYFWYFVIYSFLGWCLEVSFHTVTSGKFVNRGFLNGPVTPIYGFGMLILNYFLYPIADNTILLFIGSFFLASILEFLTGYILEKIFNTKWWDYSDMPFNIKGYISLSFSIAWGLASVFVFNFIHPSIKRFISIFDNNFGNVLLTIFILYFIADFIITVLEIMNINKHIRLLDDIEERLTRYSEHIGENIYSGMSSVIKAKEDIGNDIDKTRKDLNELREEHSHLSKHLLERKTFVHRRLLKAFPNLRKRIDSSKYNNKK